MPRSTNDGYDGFVRPRHRNWPLKKAMIGQSRIIESNKMQRQIATTGYDVKEAPCNVSWFSDAGMAGAPLDAGSGMSPGVLVSFWRKSGEADGKGVVPRSAEICDHAEQAQIRPVAKARAQVPNMTYSCWSHVWGGRNTCFTWPWAKVLTWIWRPRMIVQRSRCIEWGATAVDIWTPGPVSLETRQPMTGRPATSSSGRQEILHVAWGSSPAQESLTSHLYCHLVCFRCWADVVQFYQPFLNFVRHVVVVNHVLFPLFCRSQWQMKLPLCSSCVLCILYNCTFFLLCFN